MKIYVRKIDKQAINKQISILNEHVKDFFEDKSSVNIKGKNSLKEGKVSILLSTDPRLGGEIKQIIKSEGDMEIGDLLVIYKIKNKYVLEIIKSADDRYNTFMNMFVEGERHAEIILDGSNDDTDSENIEIAYNKIFYGIPGCGKSHHIEHVVLKGANKKENVFRTTFYLDYSNTDFVGQIYPVVEGNDVTYKRVPGPFTKALTRAYQEPNEMIYLVIEEINRGNAAAIFGDLFQLLDRLKEDYDGRFIGDSEYPISNEFIEGYLEENGITDKKGNIYIPRNLTILATMNTSDQNVFPLDTAFKRRWDRKRVIANWDDWYKANGEKKYIPFTDFTWESFVKMVNDKMLELSQDGMILEDKQIGAFFTSSDLFVTKEEKDKVTKENKEKLESFVYNVVDYIYTDVSKFDRPKWFKKNISFDNIFKEIHKFKNVEEDGTMVEKFVGDKSLYMILEEKANEADVDVDNNDYDE